MTETDSEKLDRIERLLVRLVSAVYRKGSEQDGNWGWPSFSQEMRDIASQLPKPTRPETKDE